MTYMGGVDKAFKDGVHSYAVSGEKAYEENKCFGGSGLCISTTINKGDVTSLRVIGDVPLPKTSKISSKIGELTDLTQFAIINYNLGGSIPTGVSELTNLTLLDLQNNNLTGEIPNITIQKGKGGPGLRLNGNCLTITDSVAKNK